MIQSPIKVQIIRNIKPILTQHFTVFDCSFNGSGIADERDPNEGVGASGIILF